MTIANTRVVATRVTQEQYAELVVMAGELHMTMAKLLNLMIQEYVNGKKKE